MKGLILTIGLLRTERGCYSGDILSLKTSNHLSQSRMVYMNNRRLDITVGRGELFVLSRDQIVLCTICMQDLLDSEANPSAVF